MGRKLTYDFKKLIIQKYKEQPITIDDLSEKFNISNPTAIKILDQFGIKRWTKAQLFSPNLDVDYFNTINSHQKAYYIGLLSTDGCVFWKNNKHAFWSIELQSGDKYILEELFEDIKCNRKLIYNSRSDTYTASVQCTKMVEDMEKYEIKPRSSATQRLAHNIPDEYLPDYFRGLFDGDGSFGFYKRINRNSHQKVVRICSGSQAFIDEINNEMFTRCETQLLLPYQYENTYSLTWSRNRDIEAIITFLYSTDGPYLIRKKETCMSILEEIRKYRDNRSDAAS